jgi:hypothetical protein
MEEEKSNWVDGAGVPRRFDCGGFMAMGPLKAGEFKRSVEISEDLVQFGRFEEAGEFAPLTSCMPCRPVGYSGVH